MGCYASCALPGCVGQGGNIAPTRVLVAGSLEGPLLWYWRSMWDATVEDGVLDLGGASLIGRLNVPSVDEGPKLFVRDFYPDLASEILSHRKRNAVVTGTPGIHLSLFSFVFPTIGCSHHTTGVGKTLFRNYMVYHLVQQMKSSGRAVPVILHQSPEASVLVVLMASSRGGSWVLQVEIWNIDKFYAATQSWTEFFYLLDVCNGDISRRIPFAQGRTVMFTSPNQRAYSEFKKQDCAPLYHMPLWTLEELMAAAAVRGVAVDDDFFMSAFVVMVGFPV